MDHTPQARLARARESLEGLSVGDAFGGFYEGGKATFHLTTRVLHSPPWHWTDDTNMALSIYAVLRERGEIDQDALALSFAQHFERRRGYGMGARNLLTRILSGESWQTAAPSIFQGGSFGNGGAMRVAPLGAYFADDAELCVEQARLSSQVTHAHPEGIAGTIAVALAAAQAARLRGSARPTRAAFIDSLLSRIPDSEVRQGCLRARDLPADTARQDAVASLGNGSRVSAQDTVPFCLWAAGEHLDNYEEAIWQTVSALGDADTTCAIVGGIVASYTGVDGIPQAWRANREPLPAWALGEG